MAEARTPAGTDLIVRCWAARRPDEPVLTYGDRTTTWAELDAHVDRVADALHASGAGRGGVAGFLGRNADRLWEVIFGCSRVGAAYLGLNWRLSEAELVEVVRDSGLQVLVATGEYAAVAARLRATCPSISALVVVDGEAPGAVRYEDWRASAPLGPRGGSGPDDLAFLMYTSGTTGRPKGVMIGHGAFAAAIDAHRATGEAWALLDPGDLVLLHMPMFHIAGVFGSLEQLRNGAQLHVIEQFEIERVVELLHRLPVRLIAMVPTMLRSVLEHAGARGLDVSDLRHVNYGASPMPLDLLRQGLAVLGCEFVQHYGMTEATGVGCWLPAAEHSVEGSPHMLSAGRPFPGTEVSIRDAEGHERPTGEVGEICLRSDSLMSGYWGRPDATAEALRDGWLHTGDVGYLDADGYLFIKDRLNDMIISGGENVYSGEVETALLLHPDVDEAVVVGVPHERWGETPAAFVVRRPGSGLTGPELVAATREHLAGYKLPTVVEFVDDYPRNQTGKVLKHVLRQQRTEGVAG